jgi:hypothetical protein
MKRHLNLRPYECSICKAKFARTSTLKIHYHTHTSDKTYSCPIQSCSEKFLQKGLLISHYKTHSNEDPNIISIDSEDLNEKSEKKSSSSERNYNTNKDNISFSNYYENARNLIDNLKDVKTSAPQIPIQQPYIRSEPQVNMNEYLLAYLSQLSTENRISTLNNLLQFSKIMNSPIDNNLILAYMTYVNNMRNSINIQQLINQQVQYNDLLGYKNMFNNNVYFGNTYNDIPMMNQYKC